MNIVHLNTFLKVATAGSFTRAAQELFVTQPTVTHHVQSLEEELGRQLLIRSSTGIRLTEEGKRLLDKAAELFRLIADIEGSVRDQRDEVGGTLNIAASSVMAAHFLPRPLRLLSDRYPGMEIRLHFGTAYTIATWVQNAFVDLGFAPRSPGFERLRFTPLLVEPCAPAVGAGLYARWGKEPGPDIFAGTRFILRDKGTQAHDVAVKWLKRQPWFGLLKPPAVLSDMESIKNLVLEDAGITILPRCCFRQECEQGLMREIPTAMPVDNITYYMIERANEKDGAPARVFKELLKVPDKAPTPVAPSSGTPAAAFPKGESSGSRFAEIPQKQPPE